MTAEYRARIARLLAELEIPADYGRQRNLSLQPEATDLELIAYAADDGQPVLLTPAAAAAWRRLSAAAQANGVQILPLSGYRSVARQAELIRQKRGQAISERGQVISDLLSWVAAPGYSEHHTGRALDLGTPGEPPIDEGFALTEAYRWLERRAGEFGFRLSYPRGNPHGFRFEPWHWFYLLE